MFTQSARLPLLTFACLLPLLAWNRADGEDVVSNRGYELLTEKATLTSDFSQTTFDQVWRVWPEPLRGKAEKATLEQRREMAFQRYGLTTRPGDDSG